MRCYYTAWLFDMLKPILYCMVGFCLASSTAYASLTLEEMPQKKVLIMLSYGVDYPGTQAFLQGVFQKFQQTAPFKVNYFLESLHLAAHESSEAYLNNLAESLKVKYANEKPDVILVQNKQSLSFLYKYGFAIFGNVPVAFVGYESENYNTLSIPENYTGITVDFDIKKNLELIFKNHPDIHNLYIVAGAGPTEKQLINSVLAQSIPYKDKYQFIFLNTLSYEEMLGTVHSLPQDSVILYLLLQNDVNGRIFMPAEVASDISKAGSVPVYGLFDAYVGRGVTGGFVVSNRGMGEKVAETGINLLLNNITPQGTIAKGFLGTYMFDARQLKKWGIDHEELPPESKINFVEPTVWMQYKWQIIFGVLLLVLEGILIAILVQNRAKLQKATTALEKNGKCLQKSYDELSEAHEELIASDEELKQLYSEVVVINGKLEESWRTIEAISDAAKDCILVIDVDGGEILSANLQSAKVFGYTVEELKKVGIHAIAQPEPSENFLRQLRTVCANGLQVYEKKIENSGQNIYLEFNASPLSIQGRNCCLAIARDITLRKQMAAQLEYIGRHDYLTNLYNRTYFEEQLQQLKNAPDTSFGIFICDVDGLKFINDTLGHRQGDELLKQVALLLSENLQYPDFVARIGGDEFAIMVFAADPLRMEELERNRRKAVINYNTRNPQLPLSISIGWAIGTGESDADYIFKEADNNMYRQKLHQQQSSRNALVQTMMKALEARDHITEGHADRLGDLSEKMGQALKLSASQIADLKLFAKFHDIGKVGIPDNILNKPGKLNAEEMAIMQCHCEIGYRIAKASPDLAPIADWILKHQEHWNGNGYPLGLAGNNIPLACRILAIVDAYDAMTNDRPYRKAMEVAAAMEEIQRYSGIQFDPELVLVFMKMMSQET